MSDGYRLKGPWEVAAESHAHHLQRSELEALRAENARLTRGIEDDGIHPWTVKGVRLVAAENEKLRAEVSRLTKERDEARKHVLASGAVLTADATLQIENDTLRARIQELEGILACIDEDILGRVMLETDDSTKAALNAWLKLIRAALESGTGATPPDLFCHPCCGEIDIHLDRCAVHAKTEPHGGPIDPIGPIEKPIAPAPKTFTVAEVESAIDWAKSHNVDVGCHGFVGQLRRTLGLGEP